MRTSALVPVPVLPPMPEQVDLSSPLVLVIAALCAIAAVVFGIHVIRVIFGASRSIHPLRTGLTVGGLMVALAFTAAIIDTHQRNAADQRVAEWHELEIAAIRDTVRALEDAYGITFDRSSVFVPVVARDWPSEEPVTLLDGTSTTCWFATDDGHYAVTCGGDTFETSDPLAPLP